MANSFEPGAHLKIFRQLQGVIPYYHHCIYIDDQEVIEFGGGHLFDLGATHVRTVSLSDFEDGGKAELVQHPITWMGQTYSPAGPPEQIIDRTRWLLDNQPPTYWVAHRNCEYIANWCATGDFESFQTKGAIAGKAILLDVPFLIGMRKLSPRARNVLAAAAIGLTLVSAVPYIHDSRLPKHLRTYPGLRAAS